MKKSVSYSTIPCAFLGALFEIGDDAVFRDRRIDLPLRDPLDSQVGAGFAESLPVGERLDHIDPDLDD
jgi:hypothetical protein